MCMAADGFANDALWQAAPLQVWCAALAYLAQHGLNNELPTSPNSDHPLFSSHTGVRDQHQIQRTTVALRARRIRANLRRLEKRKWPNVRRQHGGQSATLGPGGAAGRPTISYTTPYPGAAALSLFSSVMDEDSTGNFTWVYSQKTRLTTSDMSRYASSCGRNRQYFEMTYKRARFAAMSFGQGLYNFHFVPLFYELIRMIIFGNLEYRHVYAPVWHTGEIAGLLRHNPSCPCASFPMAGSMRPNSLTFVQLRDVFLVCVDPHTAALSRFISSGVCFGASR